MDRKLILDILIEPNGPTLRLNNGTGEVVMIPFQGKASGEIFSGLVEPCGVDTQVVNPAGVRHMSARYMLTGTDAGGRACHIYVENNGWFDERHEWRWPFVTVPTFYSDSPALAAYLQRNSFIGEGMEEEDGLHIRFYEILRDA